MNKSTSSILFYSLIITMSLVAILVSALAVMNSRQSSINYYGYTSMPQSEPAPEAQSGTQHEAPADVAELSNEPNAVPTEYTLSPVECEDAWDAQNCINSLNVSFIDFTPWDGPQWVGGHNAGEGNIIADFRVGDTVKVAGTPAEGTYRVLSREFITSGTKSSNVGPGFVFQTSIDDKPILVRAEKI